MYVFITPDIELPIGSTQDGLNENLPETYGPYETQNEAIGAAIDLIRSCGDDPYFKFEDFGLDLENIKITAMTETREYLAATVNKLN